MALEVTGKLFMVFATQQVNDTFKKREFVIELSDMNPNTGMTFTNYASFQLVQDKVSSIDAFNVGDEIKVSFSIRGNRWEKDGNVRFITNLNAWRVERAGDNQVNPAAQNTATAPAPSSTPPPAAAPQAPVNNEDSDLPF